MYRRGMHFPRSLREARHPGHVIEIHRDPERSIVGPALWAVAVALITLALAGAL